MLVSVIAVGSVFLAMQGSVLTFVFLGEQLGGYG